MTKTLLIAPENLTSNPLLKGLIYGTPGIGKSEPINSLVASPSGFLEIGALKINDIIFGKNGLPQKVIGVFPQGKRPVYKISTNDEAFCYADEEHIWSVKVSRRGGWKGLTTKQLLERGIEAKISKKRQESGRKPQLNFEIPICDPLLYEPIEFIIAPYILGVLIGDGSLSDNKCVITNPDQAIIDRIINELDSYYKLNEFKVAENRCRRFNIVCSGSENLYIREIKLFKLNVKSAFKFIPLIYLKGSFEQRLALLQGLMDTDGSATNNRITYSTISHKLAQDVVDLVRSLGGIAKIKKYDRVKEGKKIEFVVNIKINFCPFSLARKAKNWQKPNKISRYISNIEKTEDQECVCIMVSNEDKLYITDNYIVTHNTTLALSAPNPVCLDFDKGIRRVEAQWRVTSLPVESFDQILTLFNSDELDGFSTIVIDTLGKMIDRMGDYMIKHNPANRQKDGSLSMKGWGAVKMQFQTFLKLLDSKNKSIIFVAHESEEKEDEITKKRPDVSGSARKDIMKELDFMGYMEVINGKRSITFSPSEKFYSKNCLKIEGFVEIPSTDLGTNNFLAQKIFKLSAEKLEEEAELRETYNSLVGLLKDNISSITTIEELNNFYEEKDKKQIIWDSKIITAELFKAKVKEMGAEFDKDSKKFTIKER